MKRSLFLHSIVLFFIMLCCILQAQISFEAIVRPKEITVDQHFVVQFKLKLDKNVTIENVSFPDFSAFDFLGKSNSTQRNSQSALFIDSFTLEPLNEGVFEIGKASVTINGKIYETQPIKIIVKAGSTSSKNKQQSSKKTIPRRGELFTNETSVDTKLLVTTNNPSPYIGEEVSIKLQVLSKDQTVIENIRQSKNNRFKNFTAIDYPINNLAILEEDYEGETYYSLILLQKLLIPQQAGKITLEPFQIEYPYLVKTNQRDFFGRPVNQYIWVKLNSNELTFDVQPLPEEGKPDDFSGAVGAFNLNIFIDKNQTKAGEATQLDVEISGSGDFKMVTIPSLSIPDDLEVYESNPREAITLIPEGHKGKVSKSYTVIPQYKGKYTIPALTFSFFNPKKGQYDSLSSTDIVLHVTEGPEKPKKDESIKIPENKPFTPKKQEEVFLQPLKKTLTFYHPLVSDSILWMIIIGAILIILSSVLIFPYWKKRRLKNKKKTPETSYKKTLTLAKKALNQSDTLTFYSEIEKTLLKFLSKEFKTDLSNSTISKIKNLLQEHAVKNEKIEEVEMLLTLCNFEKYAPSSSIESMESTYKRTVNFINTFNQ